MAKATPTGIYPSYLSRVTVARSSPTERAHLC